MYTYRIKWVYCLGLVILITSCKQAISPQVEKGGELITRSRTWDQDTIFLDLKADTYAWELEGEEIVLDFKGAILQNSSFGLSPHSIIGKGILVKKVKYLIIRNATFLGFKGGIEVLEAESVRFENCHFQHFFRSRELETNKQWNAFGVLVHQATSLNLKDCSFSNMEIGLGIKTADLTQIQSSQFHFLRDAGVAARNTKSLQVTNSSFYYIGHPETYGFAIDIKDAQLEINGNSFAHIKQVPWSDWDSFYSILKENDVAYLRDYDENNWQKDKVDAALRNLGVSTPTLKLYDEFGIYDFSYPRAWYRSTKENKDVFLLTAPLGNWRLIGGSGYQQVNPKTGSFPATLQALRETVSGSRSLQFEYLGKSASIYGRSPASGLALPFEVNVQKKLNE